MVAVFAAAVRASSGWLAQIASRKVLRRKGGRRPFQHAATFQDIVAQGWLGVFLTGSDASANALFYSLQNTTAHQIGVSDTWLVAANTTGDVTGKMISPLSIAVACAATGLVGKESDLFCFTLKYSLLFAVIITMLQAYVFTGMIPHCAIRRST